MQMKLPEAASNLTLGTFEGEGKAPSFAFLKQMDEMAALPEVQPELEATIEFLQQNVRYPLLEDHQRQPTAPRQRLHTWHSHHASGDADRGIAAPKKPFLPQSLKDVQHDEEISREALRSADDTSRFEHGAADRILVSRFAHIIGASVVSQAGDKDVVKHESLQKKVLQGVKLMHLCDYSYSDVVVTLAYATVYFQSTFAAIGDKMNAYEASHVSVLLIYLAHSFILDETCPLRIWHKHIFKKYCNLKVLDAALFRVFQLRDYKLRITEDQERAALIALLSSGGSCITGSPTSRGISTGREAWSGRDLGAGGDGYRHQANGDAASTVKNGHERKARSKTWSGMEAVPSS